MRSSGLASLEAFNDGGGLLRADKYHMQKVCQDTCILTLVFQLRIELNDA
jgi:hypothetical protein